MVSVTSLDQDMRQLRMSRYTPAAAKEARAWIEDVLGEKIASEDLLAALKDGTILCRLVNKALPSPGIKFKQSNMPFVQMENISQFLRACEAPPLNMPAHDRFLTVDLYESKDPAQVLQCLGAFSRVANNIDSARFPTTIGPKKTAPMSPASTGQRSSNTSPYITSASFSRPQSIARPLSPVKTGGSNASNNATTTKGTMSPISSWSKKGDEGHTSPAWNIMQYGYMGGASQNNQGITFGGRRQITSAGNDLPNAAERERKRREQAAEDERLRMQQEEEEQRKQADREAAEERERQAEEKRWEDETKRMREQERIRLAEQKRQWDEEERKWKADEEARRAETDDLEKRLSKHVTAADSRLNGQFLSQYQAAEQKQKSSQPPSSDSKAQSEIDRVRELERQLEQARERERQYQQEREERNRALNDSSHPQFAKSEPAPAVAPPPAEPAPTTTEPSPPPSPKDSEVSWTRDPRETTRAPAPPFGSTRPLPVPATASRVHDDTARAVDSPRQASTPTTQQQQEAASPRMHKSPFTRPQEPARQQNGVDRYLASNPAPQFSAQPKTHQPAEMGLTSTLEEQADRDRRVASQEKTKAGGWASKSILEKEMERERERQREWEEQQAARPARPAGRVMGPRPPPS